MQAKEYKKMSDEPLYKKWRSMKERCYNPGHCSYAHYGGRGIKVCDEWVKSPKKFMQWAKANGYENRLQLDRIDNNGDYSPTNCRFVTAKINMNNTRRSKRKALKLARMIELADMRKSARFIASELGTTTNMVYAYLREAGYQRARRADETIGKKTVTVKIGVDVLERIKERREEEGRSIGWMHEHIYKTGLSALGLLEYEDAGSEIFFHRPGNP